MTKKSLQSIICVTIMAAICAPHSLTKIEKAVLDLGLKCSKWRLFLSSSSDLPQLASSSHRNRQRPLTYNEKPLRRVRACGRERECV